MYHQMSGRTPTGLMFCGLCTLKGPEGIAAQFLRDLFQIGSQAAISIILFLSISSTVTTLLVSESYKYIPMGLVTTIYFMYPTLVTVICPALCFTSVLLLGAQRGKEIDPNGGSIGIDFLQYWYKCCIRKANGARTARFWGRKSAAAG